MMTSIQSRRVRWALAPALAAGIVVVTLTASTSTASAADHPRLPTRTAAQLLTAIQQSTVDHLSGTVKTSTKLGLPSLPDSFGGGNSLSVQTLLSGSHTFRVWMRGAEQQRVAMIRGMAETDVVHNNADVWTYDSQTMQVTHATLSAATHAQQKNAATETAPTPAAAADQALKAIDPTTLVTVDRTARVAGRPAYQLVLQPRDARTLVGRVQIAIDSKTSLPLRTQVFARGASHPAFEVGFSSISFGTPKASIFRFTPPKGAKVSKPSVSMFLGGGLPTHVAGKPGSAPTPDTAPATHAASTPQKVLGSGWTAVAVFSAGTLDPSTSKLLDQISTRVSSGRLIKTALVSVLIADDGRILVGSVSGSDLGQVASTGRAL